MSDQDNNENQGSRFSAVPPPPEPQGEQAPADTGGLTLDNAGATPPPPPSPTPPPPPPAPEQPAAPAASEGDMESGFLGSAPPPPPAPEPPAAPAPTAEAPKAPPPPAEDGFLGSAPPPPPAVEPPASEPPAAPASPEAAPAQQPEAAAPGQPPQQGGGDKKPIRIGDRLIELGIITQDQLEVAIQEQKAKGAMLGETLVDLGFVTQETLTQFLSESRGYETFDPKGSIVDPEALELVEKKEAVKHRIIPVSLDHKEQRFVVAMADPDDVMALDGIKKLIPKGYSIVRQLCPANVVMDAIHRVYGVSTSIKAILKELSGDQDAAKQNMESLSEDEAYSHPLVRLVNAILFEGMKLGVSDLHFEPEESFARVRYRLDGDLFVAHTFHKEYWSGICQRLKIMSQMNIADKLSAQDGRFNINMAGREADFRVSAMPTVHGENIVCRILDKNASIVPLDKLGFSDRNVHLLKRSISRPEGIIIVTGPTGSGKTTTLYSVLNTVNKIDVNIMTLEDPVEYSLPNIRQSNLRPGVGLDFSEGVKALLRQDPDIIFVGEVRDGPTAEQALKAAMTGHQVFTTLHTNDSFGSIPRLLDLGLKPGMLAGSVISVFAQRLVRRICPDCKTEYQASPEELQLLGLGPDEKVTLYKGTGCDSCGRTGNKGRAAIHEVLYMEENINELIAADADLGVIKKQAYENGFVSMRDDGIEKVYQGIISLGELRKVANFSDRM